MYKRYESKFDIHKFFAKIRKYFIMKTQRKIIYYETGRKLTKTYTVHRLAAAYLGGVCYSRREEIDAQIR